MYSCADNSSKNLNYYENGNVKKLVVITNTEKIEYSFYENGQIQTIRRFNSNGLLSGEQLWFYPNGMLDQKMLYLNNKKDGNGYFFYDTTGALKHFRFFRNGKETLFGSDYWGDSMDLMKSSLHFNDSGQIFYKKNFDKNGKFVSEEGKRE
ncbi:MAG: hypothetical protein M3004_07745 [Bacteroidota bacterium]|nr:hypothetical protein [Bacteroidota bacterium]